MGAEKRKNLALEHEGRAWDLRQRGYTQRQISVLMDVDQGTVSRCLARVNIRELKRLAGVVEAHKLAQTEQLEWMVSESLRAWEKSKTPRKRASRRTVSGDEDGSAGDSVDTSEVIERDGDTAYLHTAMAGLRDIRSVWGLDVAPAVQDSASSIAAIALDMVNRGALYDQRKEAEAKAGDSPGPGSTDPAGAESVPERSEPVQ